MPAIRDFLIDFQRNQVGIFRDNGFCGIDMEGRDITSVILPHGDLKFFLVASENDRAKLHALDDELNCIKNRDKIDEARTICGSNVTVIDTSINKLQDVIDICYVFLGLPGGPKKNKIVISIKYNKIIIKI